MSDDLVREAGYAEGFADGQFASRQRIFAIEAERDALAEKLAMVVARLTAMRDDREGYRHIAHFRRGAAVELAQITGDKTDG